MYLILIGAINCASDVWNFTFYQLQSFQNQFLAALSEIKPSKGLCIFYHKLFIPKIVESNLAISPLPFSLLGPSFFRTGNDKLAKTSN
jgi:hypothetical protein